MSAHAQEFAALALPELLAAFGEPLVYRPASGPQRTVTGVIQGTRTIRETEHALADSEQLDVMVPRTDAGIAQARLGDALRREGDPSDRWYAYAGEVLSSDTAAWTLRFTRTIPFQHGRQQTRG